MDRSRGILYVATGARYRAEAARSASSFKSTMPDIPIALCTDDPDAAGGLGCFDTVVKHADARHSFIDKARPLAASPFERTLFLDTDTHSLSACYEVFDLLDHFDLAVAHAPLRGHFYFPPSCPASFPELNTGVIAYRMSSGFASLVDGWVSSFETQPPGADDQPAFREALLASRLRFAVLTPEYNLRTCFAYFLGGNADVKIVHDRGASLDRALALLKGEGRSILPRVVDPSAGGRS
jgi:hypothetical protein